MWKRALRAVTGHAPVSSAPWYRRADVWLLLGAIVLPFGWTLALGRIAWAKAAARRERQRASGAFASPLPRPEGNPGA
jgi:hypothetical protein